MKPGPSSCQGRGGATSIQSFPCLLSSVEMLLKLRVITQHYDI